MGLYAVLMNHCLCELKKNKYKERGRLKKQESEDIFIKII